MPPPNNPLHLLVNVFLRFPDVSTALRDASDWLGIEKY